MKPILFASLMGLAITLPCSVAFAQESDVAADEEPYGDIIVHKCLTLMFDLIARHPRPLVFH